VSNRVSRRQANRWSQQEEAQYQQQQAMAAPPPAAPAEDDAIAQIEKLGELKAKGLLTEEEFAAQKAKLLGM
jgi:membrane protease subunit (stomatin/prohibitin family)